MAVETCRQKIANGFVTSRVGRCGRIKDDMWCDGGGPMSSSPTGSSGASRGRMAQQSRAVGEAGTSQTMDDRSGSLYPEIQRQRAQTSSASAAARRRRKPA